MDCLTAGVAKSLSLGSKHKSRVQVHLLHTTLGCSMHVLKTCPDLPLNECMDSIQYRKFSQNRWMKWVELGDPPGWPNEPDPWQIRYTYNRDAYPKCGNIHHILCLLGGRV